MKFNLISNYKPTGDQPQAIGSLLKGLKKGYKYQTLLGVTGSGKTFTIANVINKIQKPTLVISHNKTLAAQLYQEFRDYFPDNAVSYFVSYYDYYQPEAYIPRTDTFIEKETAINEEIDKLRLKTTTNLLTRKDVIVVASVSCIYNLGSPIQYQRYIASLSVGETKTKKSILSRFVELQYTRSEYELKRSSFRVKGDTIEIWPAYLENGIKIQLLNNKIIKITQFSPLTGKKVSSKDSSLNSSIIYPAKHYITNLDTNKDIFKAIKKDLNSQIRFFKKQNKLIEEHRIRQRVNFDLEMISEFGYVNGIENYSRYFDGRNLGDPPHTLLDYFSKCDPDFNVIVDESHITLPQIRGMYKGDFSRKTTLIEHGFRLSSALDNRPLKFQEFINKVPNCIFTSATPREWEQSISSQVIEQLIRPTGLIDPQIEIRPSKNQINNLIEEIIKRVKKGERVLVTTLTKRMAEVLADFLKDKSIKVQYLHSDIKTLDRSDILDNLRLGKFDVVVGINLLREGLDLPEVSLVVILDADKEGFLRSDTSLIQTMGRASRHVNGKVIMYADQITGSMKRAINEVNRRRQIQINYNKKHSITPKSISKPIREKLIKRDKKQQSGEETILLSKKETFDFSTFNPESLTPREKKLFSKKLSRRMNQAAKELDFELAAKIRDTLELIDSD